MNIKLNKLFCIVLVTIVSLSLINEVSAQNPMGQPPPLPPQLTGFQQVYQSNSTIVLNYTEPTAVSYSWNFTCRDNTSTIVINDNSTVSNYSLDSNETQFEGMCAFSVTAFDTNSKLVSQAQLNFFLTFENLTSFTVFQGFRPQYFIGIPVRISAMPPVNSTNLTWAIICMAGNQTLLNSIQKNDSLSLPETQFNSNTSCEANFSAMNSDNQTVLRTLFFNITTYDYLANNTMGYYPVYNTSQNINISVIIPNGAKNFEFEVICEANSTIQFNQTLNTSFVNISAGVLPLRTMCWANLTYQTTSGSSGIELPFLIDNLPPPPQNQMRPQAMGLFSLYFVQQPIMAQVMLPNGSQNATFVVICLTNGTQPAFNQSFNGSGFGIQPNTLKLNTNCMANLSFTDNQNQRQMFTYMFMIDTPNVTSNGLKPNYNTTEDINVTLMPPKDSSNFSLQVVCQNLSNQTLFNQTYNGPSFNISANRLQANTSCMVNLFSLNAQNQSGIFNFVFSVGMQMNMSGPPMNQTNPPPVPQFTPEQLQQILLGLRQNISNSDPVNITINPQSQLTNVTFRLVCQLPDNKVLNQTSKNSIMLQPLTLPNNSNCNILLTASGPQNQIVQGMFGLLLQGPPPPPPMKMSNITILVDSSKVVNSSQQFNLTVNISNTSEILNVRIFVVCNNNKTYERNDTKINILTITDLKPNLFCSINVSVITKQERTGAFSFFRTEMDQTVNNTNSGPMPDCKKLNQFYDPITFKCVPSCDASPIFKLQFMRNAACVDRCPPGTSIFLEGRACVDFCPAGSGLNRGMIFNISSNMVQMLTEKGKENPDRFMFRMAQNVSFVCSPCAPECKQCSPFDNQRCLGCQGGFLIERTGNCVDKCPPGYTPNLNNGKCELCQRNCTLCPDYLVLSNGTCVETCAVDEYPDVSFSQQFLNQTDKNNLPAFIEQFRNEALFTDQQLMVLSYMNGPNAQPIIDFNVTCKKQAGPVYLINTTIVNVVSQSGVINFTIQPLNIPQNTTNLNYTWNMTCSKNPMDVNVSLSYNVSGNSSNFTFNISNVANVSNLASNETIKCQVISTVQNNVNTTSRGLMFEIGNFTSNETRDISCSAQSLFFNPVDKNCTPTCPQNAQFATPFGYCLPNCPPNFATDVDSKNCVDRCPPNRALWNGQCIDCGKANLTFFQEFCVVTCPQGFTKTNGACALDMNSIDFITKQLQNNCTYQNKLADIELRQCVDNCSNSKFLDDSTASCVKTCPPNLIPNEITRKCESNCSNNSVLFQGKCIKQLENCDYPDPTYPLRCLDCKDNSYLLPASEICVLTCPVGYAPNNDTWICEPKCESNCTRCGDFQALSNGVCVNSCPDSTVPAVIISPVLQQIIPFNVAQDIQKKLVQRFQPKQNKTTVPTYRELGIPSNIINAVLIQCQSAGAPVILLPKFRSTIPPSIGVPIRVQFQSGSPPQTTINISCAFEGQNPYFTNSSVNQPGINIPPNTTRGGSRCTISFMAKNELGTTNLTQFLNILDVLPQNDLQQLITLNKNSIQSNQDPLGFDVSPLFEQLKSYVDAINNGEAFKAQPIIRIVLLNFDTNGQIQNKISLPASVENNTASKISTFILPPQTTQGQCRLSVQITFDTFPEFMINVQSALISVLPQSLAEIKQAVLAQPKSVDDIKQQDVGDIKNLLLSLQTALGKGTKQLSNDVLDANGQIDHDKYKQKKDAEKNAQIQQQVNAKKAQLANPPPPPVCNDTVCNGQGNCFVANNQLACKCNDNFKGQFCSLSTQDFQNAVALKSNIAAALLEKPVTSDNCAQVAESITSLASDADTISEDSVAKMAQAIQNATSIFGKDVKPNTDQVLSFVDATDSLLSVAFTKNSVQNVNKATTNVTQPTAEQIQQIKSTISKAITSAVQLLQAVALNLDPTTKTTQTVVSSNFKAQLGFVNTSAGNVGGRLRRLQNAQYVSFESSSSGVVTAVKIPTSALSNYDINLISYQNQLWYVNNRDVIDNTKNISTYILQAGISNTDTQSAIALSLNDKSILITIPLLVEGSATSNYSCLIWQSNVDGTESWNNQTCIQQSVTTTSVTCACPKLGEVSASFVVPTTTITIDNNTNNNNTNNNNTNNNNTNNGGSGTQGSSATVTTINQITLLVICLFFALIAYN